MSVIRGKVLNESGLENNRGYVGIASELINFTRMLLSGQYSEQDIEKICGGNFLRVMSQVQSVRK